MVSQNSLNSLGAAPPEESEDPDPEPDDEPPPEVEVPLPPLPEPVLVPLPEPLSGVTAAPPEVPPPDVPLPDVDPLPLEELPEDPLSLESPEESPELLLSPSFDVDGAGVGPVVTVGRSEIDPAVPPAPLPEVSTAPSGGTIAGLDFGATSVNDSPPQAARPVVVAAASAVSTSRWGIRRTVMDRGVSTA